MARRLLAVFLVVGLLGALAAVWSDDVRGDPSFPMYGKEIGRNAFLAQPLLGAEAESHPVSPGGLAAATTRARAADFRSPPGPSAQKRASTQRAAPKLYDLHAALLI
jgi:hypothetical protein